MATEAEPGRLVRENCPEAEHFTALQLQSLNGGGHGLGRWLEDVGHRGMGPLMGVAGELPSSRTATNGGTS
ncbi:MAG: hypothetical protein RLZZ515_2563, partial [Cyanobacteriota bacterium]